MRQGIRRTTDFSPARRPVRTAQRTRRSPQTSQTRPEVHVDARYLGPLQDLERVKAARKSVVLRMCLRPPASTIAPDSKISSGATGMDDSAFDAATQHLAAHLSRRGIVGAMTALGVGVGLLNDNADARSRNKRKKKKKKRSCNCAPCSTCFEGSCIPLPDGEPCGSNGVCSHNVCARKCTYDPEEFSSDCPAGQFCVEPVNPSLPRICTSNLGNACGASSCGASAQCPAAQSCIRLFCESGPFETCLPVTTA